MPRIYNLEVYNPIRHDLRHAMTPAEVMLWSHLKWRGLLGYKFRRQHGVGRYIVDLYCPKLKMAVELDGGQHFEPHQIKADHERQRWIESLGILVVRYTNHDIETNLEGVLEDLGKIIKRRAVSGDHPWLTPSPPHPRRGRA